MTQDILQTPTVSVCVPSYNHSRYVRLCLESVFAQTYRNIQLIVIDDGSTDDSVKVIEKTLKDCPFDCEFVVRPNKGLVATLNEALEKSRGEFLAELSSDDLWLPEFLQRRVGQMQKHPNAVLAYGHCFLINESNKIFGTTNNWVDYGSQKTQEMLLALCFPQAPTVIYRKSVLAEQKWNDIFPEDIDLYLRLCVLGEFAFDANLSSAYRTHPHNSARRTKQLLNGQIQSFRRNADILGLSEQDLIEMETKINWQSIDLYLNYGKCLEAVKTALKYSHIKAPVASKIRQYAKLLMPQSVLRTLRKNIKRNSDKWHGLDIEDLITDQIKTGKSFSL